MKAEDVINQLKIRLPVLTDQFTQQFSIASILRSANIATATTTAPHGLVTGAVATFVDSDTETPISSVIRTDDILEVITTLDHDFTLDQPQIRLEGSIKVVLAGSTEVEFNGTFDLVGVPNRQTLQLAVLDAGPTVGTGSPVLVNGLANTFNGTFNVTVTGPNAFTYVLPSTNLPASASGASIVGKTAYRISGAATFERAQEAYTRQGNGELWAFVVLDDVLASKDRRTQSDATAILNQTNDYRQQVIFPISVFIFAPASDTIAGRQARDDMEVLRPLLFRSLLGLKFDCQLTAGAQQTLVYVQDGIANYDTAVYIHSFNFETVADISFGDSVGFNRNVAFRDIDYSIIPIFDLDVDNETVLTGSVDLDEQPL